MKVISTPQRLHELWENRDIQFTEMMKIVVDVARGIIAIDADMHADLEELLLQDGSMQSDLWGANVYPYEKDEAFIEFTSFINIRPSDNNRSMEVKDPLLRAEITEIVNKLMVR